MIVSNLIIRHYLYKVSVLDSISYDLYSGEIRVRLNDHGG